MATKDGPTADWATFVTRRLDTLVDLVRNRAVKPAARATRTAVMGTLTGVVGIAVVLIVLIGLVHLFDTTVFRGHAFITDFAVGGILLGAGAFLLRASVKAGKVEP